MYPFSISIDEHADACLKFLMTKWLSEITKILFNFQMFRTVKVVIFEKYIR